MEALMNFEAGLDILDNIDTSLEVNVDQEIMDAILKRTQEAIRACKREYRTTTQNNRNKLIYTLRKISECDIKLDRLTGGSHTNPYVHEVVNSFEGFSWAL